VLLYRNSILLCYRVKQLTLGRSIFFKTVKKVFRDIIFQQRKKRYLRDNKEQTLNRIKWEAKDLKTLQRY